MSGHSKWSKIKRQKGVADVKKGKIFSQLSKAVTLAAKDGGGDASMNPASYGPEGVALIIEGTTDNTNRTVAEIKHILSMGGGRLGEVGSVKWMFERFGYLEVDKKDLSISDDDLEMLIIDSGADDFKLIDDVVVVYTKPEDLYKVKEDLEKNNIKISDSGFEWKAKNKIKVDDEKINKQVERLFEALDEQEDVGEVFSNLEELDN